MGRMVFTRQGERSTGSWRDITKTWTRANISVRGCAYQKGSQLEGGPGMTKREEKEGCVYRNDGDSITKGPVIGFHSTSCLINNQAKKKRYYVGLSLAMSSLCSL